MDLWMRKTDSGYHWMHKMPWGWIVSRKGYASQRGARSARMTYVRAWL